MEWTTKDKQLPGLRAEVEKHIDSFSSKRPTRTIDNHHYIRQRDLEQFMYDFAVTILGPRYAEFFDEKSPKYPLPVDCLCGIPSTKCALHTN